MQSTRTGCDKASGHKIGIRARAIRSRDDRARGRLHGVGLALQRMDIVEEGDPATVFRLSEALRIAAPEIKNLRQGIAGGFGG